MRILSAGIVRASHDSCNNALRRDGGDAETGASVDLGGGLVVSDTLSGLSADVRVRTLLAHQDEGLCCNFGRRRLVT